MQRLSRIRNLLFAVFVLLASTVLGQQEKLVFVFYYAWYSNPHYDSDWQHWQEYDHRPPLDVSSSYYPQLGAYSSRDPYVIDRHMKWISAAGINVLIYSWWGRTDPTEKLARTILDAAADYNLQLAFLIEPYAGRTPASICEDIEYLTRRYGGHPSFFRMQLKNGHSDSPRKRGVFFIYQPDDPAGQLRRLSDRVHGSHFDSVLLLQTTDVKLAEESHADGLFAYEAYLDVQGFYTGIVSEARARNLLFLPCVSPGFNMNRTYHTRYPLFRPRRFGTNYDEWWREALAADPQFITIVSFNEWHEGTQIEPAIEPVPRRSYYSYNGSYRKQGRDAVRSYLQRTAYWIRLFQNQP